MLLKTIDARRGKGDFSLSPLVTIKVKVIPPIIVLLGDERGVDEAYGIGSWRVVAHDRVCGDDVGTTTEIATFGESTHALTEKIDRVIDSYNTTALEREFTDLASLYSDSHTKDLTREALLEIRKPITPKQKKNFSIEPIKL